ncbi:MAG: DUF952 domain-containing protein [Nitratireductor sp.]
MVAIIYKIVTTTQWKDAEAAGEFRGAPIDISDGYIHFSTAGQVRETAAKHFAGQNDLLLVAVDADKLGDQLRHEPSRGGALFPHLYAVMPLDAVVRTDPLPLDSKGNHIFPAGVSA